MSKYKKPNKNYEVFYKIFLVIMLIIAAVTGINVYFSNCETTNNAVIEGKLISVSPKIPGLIVNMYVDIEHEVKKGDLIIELDRVFYENALREAENQLRETKIKLATLDAEERNTQSGFSKTPLSKFKFNNYKGFFDNYSKMYGEEVNQEEQTEGDVKYLTAKESPKYKKPEQKQKAETPKEEDKDKLETREELEERIKLLEAEVEQAKLNLSYTKIYAPQDGTVSVINLRQGEYVDSAQTILAIIPKRVWINANFTEEQANRIDIGQKVYIKVNKYPTRTFKGVVDNIQKNSNEPATYIKGVKYIPVRIMFTEDYSDFDLQPGTPAKVTVRVDKF